MKSQVIEVLVRWDPGSSRRAGGTYFSEEAPGFSSLSDHWNPLKAVFHILNSGHGWFSSLWINETKAWGIFFWLLHLPEKFPLHCDWRFWLFSTITYHFQPRKANTGPHGQPLVCSHLLLIGLLWSKTPTFFHVSSYCEWSVDMGSWQSSNNIV